MGTILVVYYSQTGNTRKMAELIAEGAGASGKHKVKLAPVEKLGMPEFVRADGFALGSPDYFTYMAGEMKMLFDRALTHVKEIKGKPFVSFVSHGGGGGAIESLDKLGLAIGLTKAGEGLKCQGSPAKDAIRECRELGEQLAKATG
jgi:flavorubredoxin